MTRSQSTLTAMLSVAAAAAMLLSLHSLSRPRAASTSVVLARLRAAGEYRAARAGFRFSFRYSPHGGSLFPPGASVLVTGRGTGIALIDFSRVTASDVLSPGATSISVILRPPRLGVFFADGGRTMLVENGKARAPLSRAFSADPGDAKAAFAAARHAIATSAAAGHLIGQGKADVRAFLVTFLRQLGFIHVTVVFM